MSRAIVVVLGGLLLTGCHQQAARRALVERELRHQEDRIYQLQDYIRQYQDLLASCRRENLTLKRELGIADDLAEPPAAGPTVAPAERPGEFAPPLIEPGSPTEPGNLILPGPEGEDLGELSDGPATELVINKLLTGGLDTNEERPGDEALMVVVEPRAADGKLVRRPGELSLMVTDPNQPGPEGRVARWDFSADEAAAAFHKTLLGRGLHLQLPWPHGVPDAEELLLTVRVVTPAGEKLTAEAEIAFDPPAASVARQGPELHPATQAAEKSWSRSPRPPRVAEGEASREEHAKKADVPQTARLPEWKPYR